MQQQQAAEIKEPARIMQIANVQVDMHEKDPCVNEDCCDPNFGRGESAEDEAAAVAAALEAAVAEVMVLAEAEEEQKEEQPQVQPQDEPDVDSRPVEAERVPGSASKAVFPNKKYHPGAYQAQSLFEYTEL
jgi:hypothetical protein